MLPCHYWGHQLRFYLVSSRINQKIQIKCETRCRDTRDKMRFNESRMLGCSTDASALYTVKELAEQTGSLWIQSSYAVTLLIWRILPWTWEWNFTANRCGFSSSICLINRLLARYEGFSHCWLTGVHCLKSIELYSLSPVVNLLSGSMVVLCYVYYLVLHCCFNGVVSV